MSASKVQIQITVNGKRRQLVVHSMKRLLDVIREDLRLTGTKEGCGEGECGACSVLLEGKLVNSCLVPAAQADRCRLITIEGLESKRSLHPIQKCFLECGGAQCGICTPGMILATQALISKKKRPKPVEVREWLAGNLCRCTGFKNIVDSVMKSTRRGRSA